MNIKFALKHTNAIHFCDSKDYYQYQSVFFFKFAADVIVGGGIDAGAGTGWKFMQTQYEIQHCN